MLYINLWLKEHSIFKNAIEQISETLLLVIKCALDTPQMLYGWTENIQCH